jgi:hypothetical protein
VGGRRDAGNPSDWPVTPQQMEATAYGLTD